MNELIVHFGDYEWVVLNIHFRLSGSWRKENHKKIEKCKKKILHMRKKNRKIFVKMTEA